MSSANTHEDDKQSIIHAHTCTWIINSTSDVHMSQILMHEMYYAIMMDAKMYMIDVYKSTTIDK